MNPGCENYKESPRKELASQLFEWLQSNLKEQGTWYLFHCHSLTFAIEVVSLAVALLLTYGKKLV